MVKELFKSFVLGFSILAGIGLVVGSLACFSTILIQNHFEIMELIIDIIGISCGVFLVVLLSIVIGFNIRSK